LQVNYYFAELGYWGGHILFSTFYVFMLLSVSRVLFIAFIATKSSSGEEIRSRGLVDAGWGRRSAGEHYRAGLQ